MSNHTVFKVIYGHPLKSHIYGLNLLIEDRPPGALVYNNNDEQQAAFGVELCTFDNTDFTAVCKLTLEPTREHKEKYARVLSSLSSAQSMVLDKIGKPFVFLLPTTD